MEDTYMEILKYVIAAVAGGLLGFAIYKFIGCSTGSCPITSNPYISIIYGVVMGLLIASSV
jgi:hypothetical protein